MSGYKLSIPHAESGNNVNLDSECSGVIQYNNSTMHVENVSRRRTEFYPKK